MSLSALQILTGGGFGDRRSKIQAVDVPDVLIMMDATLSENPKYENDITDHPVEDGSEVTDHANPKPIMLEIEGEVSDSPMSLEGALLNALSSGIGAAVGNGIGGGFGSAVGAVAGGFVASAISGPQSSPSQQAYNYLLQLWKNRIPVTITTSLTVYNNMMLQSLSVPRDPSTGQKLKFTMSFKEVRFVKTQDVQVTNLEEIVKHTAGATAELGSQGANATKASRRASLLKQGVRGIGSLFSGGA